MNKTLLQIYFVLVGIDLLLAGTIKNPMIYGVVEILTAFLLVVACLYIWSILIILNMKLFRKLVVFKEINEDEK